MLLKKFGSEIEQVQSTGKKIEHSYVGMYEGSYLRLFLTLRQENMMLIKHYKEMSDYLRKI